MRKGGSGGQTRRRDGGEKAQKKDAICTGKGSNLVSHINN